MSRKGGARRRVLVVTLDAYRFSTRSRKAAIQYRMAAPTMFLGLSGVGRTGRWDKPGEFVVDDIDVRQVYVRRPRVAPTRYSQIRNVLLSYLPALMRLAWVVLRTPSAVVHVTGAPLVLLGLIHRARFRSCLVLDVQERPGAVAARGSVTSLFSRVESWLLRHASQRVDVVTVVTHADVEAVAELGFRRIVLVRNAPLSSWRAPYHPPRPSGTGRLSMALVGTIFEGRGYELILRSVARVTSERDINLKIYGLGRDEYMTSLRTLTETLGISDHVEWMGRIDSADVSRAYLDADLGLAIYEVADPGNDGLSNKILECVASGRPVIAGNLPENRRFVDSYGVGWLTAVTIEGMAEAMRTAGADCDLADLCTKCRKYGDTWLNWESEFAQVLRTVGPCLSVDG